MSTHLQSCLIQFRREMVFGVGLGLIGLSLLGGLSPVEARSQSRVRCGDVIGSNEVVTLRIMN